MFGRILGCFNEAASLAACISLHQSVFLQPFAQQQQQQQAGGMVSSDSPIVADELAFFLPRLKLSEEGGAYSDPIAALNVFDR